MNLYQIEREQEVQFGLHSNIPKCCCEYFVDTWIPSLFGSTKLNTGSSYRKKIEARENELDKDFCYIPCPSCLESAIPNRLHICGEDCTEYLESILSPQRVENMKLKGESELRPVRIR